MASDIKIKVSAQDDASKVLQGVRNSLDSLAAGAASLGLAGAVAAAALVMVKFTKATIDGLDALNDLKDATGSSIENLSALEDIAARTGTSFDTVGGALIKFNSVLKDAKPGSDAELAITSLGLKLSDLKDLDPSEALLKTAVALNGFADDGNKARLAQELFGKSIGQVAPLLNDLAEKGKLVSTTTTEQTKAAEAFNNQLGALGKNVTDVSRSVISAMLPAILKLTDEMAAASKVSAGFFDSMAIQAGQNPFKDLAGNLEASRLELEKLQKLQKSLGNLADNPAMDNQIAAAKRDLAYYEELTAKAKQRAALANPESRPSAPDTSALSASKEKATKDQAAANVEYKKQQDLLTTLSGLNTDYFEQMARLGALRKSNNIDEERYLQLVQDLALKQPIASKSQSDYAKVLADQAKALTDAQDAYEKYIDSLVKEQDALSKSNDTLRQNNEEIGLTKEAVAALQVARLDATIAQEEAILVMMQSNEAQEGELLLLQRKIDLLKEQRNLTAAGALKQVVVDTKTDQDKLSKEYAETLKNDLKGAFSAAFRDSKDPLKAFGDALENVMFTRASTALASALADQAVKSFAATAGSSGVGDFFAKLFGSISFDGGGYTGNAPRTGGVDGKGGFLSLLHPQETVLDHTRGQTLGGTSDPVVINQTVNIDSRSDQATILAAMNSAKNMAMSEILNSRRRGGTFA